ncbi:phytanoyl-CoA dioxygenase family protein [Oceanospirillum sediminis]|uniref:Phytanoyl-CoA dioxygenase family protein n=1 Tax=Oceanospirillum sediminis TaxID=2760088 RepID=A0A839IVN7_9GAMM|nr:phytanoyl-CoA dioxygenase family protein [Oceanospirillum sediminis]MBB1488684.1 phytanoyl-CoA dioxygenase family protein [Oceanospirillum sediminis]
MEQVTEQALPDSQDSSSLGIPHLKRFWHKHQLSKLGQLDQGLQKQEWPLDLILIDELNLGLEPAMTKVYQSSRLSDFESFVLSKNDGCINSDVVQRLEKAVMPAASLSGQKDHVESVLTDQQMMFWQENGYIVIPSVLTQQECDEALEEIGTFLNFSLQDPGSWYLDHDDKQLIMVQFYDGLIQKKIRAKKNIRAVFAQIWQTNHLTVTLDRVSVNPPETESWRFPGPSIHWDMDHFNPPIPFRTQGLIYLTDTAENQGAFSCVPGFHLQIDDWLSSLPADVDPQNQNWSEFNVKPIAAKAGDLIIWHHALPHGSSPNVAQSPRVVQYLNMYPLCDS